MKMTLRAWCVFAFAAFATGETDEGLVDEFEGVEQEWSMARARGADRADLEDENDKKLGDLHERKNELLLELDSLDDALEEVNATAGRADPTRRRVKNKMADAGGGLPYGHPSKTKTYPKYPGFTLWLVEEFEEPIDLDKDQIWTWSDGGLGEGDVRFVKDQIKFQDGKMMVEVARNHGQTPSESCSHAEVNRVGRKPLLSGEMRTKYNMFRYGRYEVNMKVPSVRHNDLRANGNYISTMFVYRDAKYQNWREIDIEITADSAHAVTSNMLSANHISGWQPGIQKSVHGNFNNINTRKDFNTYAFEWIPNQISWFINGKKTRTQRSGHLKVPDMPGKIMMNLWIFRGGGFGGGNVRNNQYPMHSEYDWFRFYKYDKDHNYPCGPDGSCLPSKDTKILSSNNPCDGIKNEGRFRGHICVASKRNCNGPH